MQNVNHVEIIERMMEYLKTHTVDGVPIRPTLEAAKAALEKQEKKKVKGDRLTKRAGNRVYINDGTIRRSECKGELGVTFCIHAHTCEYAREPERRCPVLRIMDRLAECEDADDLINRQQAEVEKLNIELDAMRSACNSYKMHYEEAKAEIERLQKNIEERKKDVDYFCVQTRIAREKEETARAEAIKEFAERLKERNSKYICDLEIVEVYDEIVDNLVKEMTEKSR